MEEEVEEEVYDDDAVKRIIEENLSTDWHILRLDVHNYDVIQYQDMQVREKMTAHAIYIKLMAVKKKYPNCNLLTQTAKFGRPKMQGRK